MLSILLIRGDLVGVGCWGNGGQVVPGNGHELVYLVTILFFLVLNSRSTSSGLEENGTQGAMYML